MKYTSPIGQTIRNSCRFFKVFDREKVQSALKVVYENNVRNFCGGKMGAVNGTIRGKVDQFTVQSEEVWTGVTYALASHFLHQVTHKN